MEITICFCCVNDPFNNIALGWKTGTHTLGGSNDVDWRLLYYGRDGKEICEEEYRSCGRRES